LQTINTKFESMVRGLRYKYVSITSTPAPKIESFIENNWPEVYLELKTKGWDLEKDSTWEEAVFVKHTMSWYNHRIGVYLTDSIRLFDFASKIVNYPAFRVLRDALMLDAQVVVLCNRTPFISAETLDDIYLNIDFDKGTGSIDCSGYGSEEDLLFDEYAWLNAELKDDGNYVPVEHFHTLWAEYRLNDRQERGNKDGIT